MFDTYHDILTVEEACEALRVGSNALYDLLTSGSLKGFHNGRTWRIPKAALIAYVNQAAGLQETQS